MQILLVLPSEGKAVLIRRKEKGARCKGKQRLTETNGLFSRP